MISNLEEAANKTGTRFVSSKNSPELNLDYRIKKQETMQEHYDDPSQAVKTGHYSSEAR